MSNITDDIPVKDVSEAYRTKSLVMEKDRASARRSELQDRLHHLTDENVFLKKHSRKQEDKLKQLEAKLSRILAEKRYSGKKDEWDAEESRHRIMELEYQVGMLKDRLQVAKQQLVSYTRLFPVQNKPKMKHARATPSNSSSGMCNQTSSDLPEQFEILLLEAKTENQALESQIIALRDQVRSLERELSTTKELLQIKEITYEDELNVLRSQVDDAEHTKQKLADNIQLIRLQRDSRRAASWLSTLETQCKALEASLTTAQETNQSLESQLGSTQEELRESQQQNLNLQKQVEQLTSDSSKIKELEALVTSLKEENGILKELNSSLEAKAVTAAEKVHKMESEESHFKSQLAQLETTLRNELQSKSDLYSDLSREKLKVQSLTEQLANLQATDKYANQVGQQQRIDQAALKTAEPLVGVSQINIMAANSDRDESVDLSVSVCQTGISQQRPRTPVLSETSEPVVSIPMTPDNVRKEVLQLQPVPILPVVRTDSSVQVDLPRAAVQKVEVEQCEHCKKLEEDLKQTQCSMTSLKDDLIRTKNLLKGQMATNRECHREVEQLNEKIEKADKLHQLKLQEFLQALDERSSRMAVLEENLELIKTQSGHQPLQQVSKSSVEIQVGSSSTCIGETQTSPEVSQRSSPIRVPSVEIFIDKFIPNEEYKHLLQQGLFATWDYGQSGTKYTPVVRNGLFGSGSTHALGAQTVKPDVEIQLHQAVGPTDCVTLGSGTLSLENNSCTLLSSSEPGRVLGELRYTFRAHGANDGTKSISSVDVGAPANQESQSSDDFEPQVNDNVASNPLKHTTPSTSLAPSPAQGGATSSAPIPKPKPRIIPHNLNADSQNSEGVLLPKRREKSIDLSTHTNLRPLNPLPRQAKLQRGPNVEETEESEHSEVLSDITNSPPARKDGLWPRKPILRREGSSPDVKRKNSKRVTMTEIVEERRIPTPDDENTDYGESKSPVRQVPFGGGGNGGPSKLQVPLIRVDAAAGEGSKNLVVVKASSGQGQWSDSSESGEGGRTVTGSTLETGEIRESQCKTDPNTSENSVDDFSSSQDSAYGKHAVRIEIAYLVFHSPCRIWSDPKIKKLYVEFKFLNYSPEELETPSSVPKPQPGKKAEFNFSKLFFIDTKEKRELLKIALLEKKNIRFTIVSEPPENDSLDCEDVGYAYVPFNQLAKNDLVQEDVPVYDAENPKHQQGILCLTIQAKDAIMSL